MNSFGIDYITNFAVTDNAELKQFFIYILVDAF